jgi:myo-inositol-1(or 4)-monophosphatase
MPNPIDVALKAAAEASHLLLDRRGKAGRILTKQNRTDLVSEADFASEAVIVKIVREAFPSHVIVAEEGSAGGGDDEHRWYIDPLDGTLNFVHEHPFWGVSIGYEFRGELVSGVVSAPVLGEVFHAEAGSGAYLNRTPIRVSEIDEIEDAMLSTGFAYGFAERMANVKYWEAFLARGQAVRRDGAAALDLAWVACGRFDAFWESPLQPWDVAAGAVIVAEAGGTVTNYTGARLDVKRPSIVASNAHLHSAMLKVIAETSSKYSE